MVLRARRARKAGRVKRAIVRGPRNFEPRTLNFESRLSRTTCSARPQFTNDEKRNHIARSEFKSAYWL